ncbi:zinc ribbon domain-containing protein [Eubacterium ramulus]
MDRVYLCTCGNRIDRDLNAAINIREEALTSKSVI